jgi:hypothetical protein
MEMIGHHNKVMQPELFGGEVVSQNVDEEIGHAFGLQERAAAKGFRGHKESARTFLDVVAVCVARRPCHAQGGYARFALLRASLRRKEGALFLRLCGTAKSRALTLVWSMDAVWRCRRMRGACRHCHEKLRIGNRRVLRASRCCARALRAAGGRYFAALRHG